MRAGFLDRANATSYITKRVLLELVNWVHEEPGRTIGVKLTGHSLGAASATIAGAYVETWLESQHPEADIEVYAYASPTGLIPVTSRT
jgi:hypothetical protein